MASDSSEIQPERRVWPLSDLRTFGLLWLINKVVFHPRGFALGLELDDETGDVTGWGMIGDGTEPWSFGNLPDGTPIDDDSFTKVEAFLEMMRTPPEVLALIAEEAASTDTEGETPCPS